MAVIRRWMLSLVVVVVLAACGGGSPAPEVARGPVDVPAPTGDVVLSVSGEVGRPNVGPRFRADLAGLESLGLVDFVVADPFVGADLALSGVLLDTVLASAGVAGDAPLRWVALDQYEVYFTRSELAAEGAYLATRQDGAPIEIADGGPIRVVFPDDDGTLGRDSNQWIWSVVEVTVG